MKLFANWRAVGRAMLDARRRKGVTVVRSRSTQVRSRTYRSTADAVVWVGTLPGSTWFKTYTGQVGSTDVHPNSAAEGLRVLAALELIPADIAYAADERYGRCVKCGRLAEWWAAEAGAEDRWVHAEPWLVTDHHNAEVADA